MQLRLRPALATDFPFCESLSRSNMAPYHSDRGIAWDPKRFLASWANLETSIICADDSRAGLLALLVVDGALEIRDLQLVPTLRGRGIGTWTIAQAQSEAVARGLATLRLRVYADNPASRLYARLGFKVESSNDGVLYLACELPTGE